MIIQQILRNSLRSSNGNVFLSCQNVSKSLNKFLISQGSILSLSFSKLTSTVIKKSTGKQCCRYMSSESGPPSNKLPPLMEFPKITWPSLVKSIKNFMLVTFIIKPYFDRDFNLPDFVIGSKKALEVCKAIKFY